MKAIQSLVSLVIQSLVAHTTNSLSGMKAFQPMFESLLQISLKGMNVGEGSDIATSGEKFVLNYVKKQPVKKRVIIDVGAHIGDFSIQAAKICADVPTTIHAFEPLQSSYNNLKKNVKSAGNIVVHQQALGDKKCQITLYYNSRHKSKASLYRRNMRHFNIHLSKTETVTVNTIDEFCKKNDISTIHLLKIDAEGNELDILKGGSTMIKSGKIDFIQFEFGGCNIDSRTYFQDFYYFLSDRYILFRVVKDGLYPITKYKEEYELFKATNYLAQRRQLATN